MIVHTAFYIITAAPLKPYNYRFDIKNIPVSIICKNEKPGFQERPGFLTDKNFNKYNYCNFKNLSKAATILSGHRRTFCTQSISL